MIWIYVAVTVVASLYAAVLNIKRVHDWHTPDRTWVTVVIGNGIILGGLLAACYAGIVAWYVWWIAFYLNCAAGGPIIVWQLIRAAKRHRRALQILVRG